MAFIPYKNKYTERKADIQPVRESIQELLKVYRLHGKISQTQVIEDWDKFMGKAIALKTRELYFKDRKLFVVLTSASLKHQLNMSKTKVIDILNQQLGQDYIQEIVFL